MNASGAVSMASGHDVDVHMRDGLAGRGSVVHSDGGAIGSDGPACDPAQSGHEGEEVGGLARGEVLDAGSMGRRNDEDVTVGEGLDVEKGYGAGFPRYDLGGDFSLDDLAEEAGHRLGLE